MISFRQADLLRSLKGPEELPEVHLTIDVIGSNMLEVHMGLTHPPELQEHLLNLVEASLLDVGFYQATDETMSWAVNGDSDDSAEAQIEVAFEDIKESFVKHGFSIHTAECRNPYDIITGSLMRFILELPKP